MFSTAYQPFGQDNGTPTGSETYKFTGKPVSQTTGLYYYYQRWYDPPVGRFISRDPIPSKLSDPQSSNEYVYVTNSPTTFADPSGTNAVNVLNPPIGQWCWDWFGLLPCSSQQGRVIVGNVGDPPTGITTGAGSGVGVSAGAIVLSELAFWGLKTGIDRLFSYIRTPPTRTEFVCESCVPDHIGDVNIVTPGSTGPNLTVPPTIIATAPTGALTTGVTQSGSAGLLGVSGIGEFLRHRHRVPLMKAVCLPLFLVGPGITAFWQAYLASTWQPSIRRDNPGAAANSYLAWFALGVACMGAVILAT